MENAALKAERAIKWIDSLSKTRTASQWKYLGCYKFGYNFIGYGCRLFQDDIIYFPDDKYSEQFCEFVGLIDKFGSFHKPKTTIPYYHIYKGNKYLSLRNMSKTFSFRRLASIMKDKHNCYKLFHREVADLIQEHYAQVRASKINKMIHG